MTIQEAIKSGKRYRRKYDSFGDSFGKIIKYKDSILFEYRDCELTGHLSSFTLDIDDILADDWEIEREPETIWLVKHLNHDFYDGVFRCEDMAKRSTAASNKNASVVKFREVIE